jgi:hypothetical protein
VELRRLYRRPHEVQDKPVASNVDMYINLFVDGGPAIGLPFCRVTGPRGEGTSPQPDAAFREGSTGRLTGRGVGAAVALLEVIVVDDTKHLSYAERADALISLLVMKDSVRWQGPALALAAQSFLLTVALGSDGTPFTRITAAALGLATSIAAMHLVFRKGRQVKVLRDGLKEYHLPAGGLEGGASASMVWILTLVLFMAANILIIILAASNSHWLPATASVASSTQCAAEPDDV